ncbi:hypothetical protein QR680_014794 [Steinernema hermaphroditum]|uniref:Uncharacterized protein n=1 Tax=Steinernema hermaphroditum TaxID=289476 RepID=A0AA39IBK4_9BILA|nr:hypothetical protein QR680_014794 [Steinernema hermaphroditum]
MKSSELVQVDLGLSRAINRVFRGTAKISPEILKQCQRLLSLHPEFNAFCSRLDNDFAKLPVDIIVDVINISQPFSKRPEHEDKRYLLHDYSNMAKVKGSWGAQVRALKSFEYSFDYDSHEDNAVMERTFFDDSGELKTQAIALNEVGRERVTYSELRNYESIKDIAPNFCDYLKISSIMNDFIHSADLLLCKPTLTTVDIYVGRIDRALDEFLTRQLKSRILRTFRAANDYGPHFNEEWNDLFAKFVKKDDFISLFINTGGLYSRRIIEGAVEKWMRSTVRTNQQVFMRLSEEDKRLCEEYVGSLAFEKKSQVVIFSSVLRRYSIKHPSNLESSLSVEISDDTGGCPIKATFSVIPEIEDSTMN